jgi:hypothetical protein
MWEGGYFGPPPYFSNCVMHVRGVFLCYCIHVLTQITKCPTPAYSHHLCSFCCFYFSCVIYFFVLKHITV